MSILRKLFTDITLHTWTWIDLAWLLITVLGLLRLVVRGCWLEQVQVRTCCGCGWGTLLCVQRVQLKQEGLVGVLYWAGVLWWCLVCWWWLVYWGSLDRCGLCV